jgi:uncharacterized protein
MIRFGVRAILLAVIGSYRVAISPFIPHCCRFHPTCSAYADEAIRTHGAFRGGLMAVRRLLRCSPLHVGGLDPVPGTEPSRTARGA